MEEEETVILATDIRPKGDRGLGWAFRPDKDTRDSLARGVTKFKRNHKKTGHVLGADRPHEGGNLAEALIEARKELDKSRGIKPQRKRRRKMAKKVSLKELSELKKGKLPSKKKTVVEDKSDKLISLKKICSELDLDPKATRVKLRRMIANGDIDWHDHSARWEFSPKRAKEVRALLSAD